MAQRAALLKGGGAARSVPSTLAGALRCALQRRAVRSSTAAAASQRQVSHILLKPDQQELLEQLSQRLEDGEPLAELAAQHSACPSAAQGGALGWLSRGAADPAFDAAAFGAPLGGLARCSTRHGLHLLRVHAERAAPQVLPMAVEELAEVLRARGTSSSKEAGGAAGGLQLVDVREEWEAELSSLPGFRLLPLSRFQEWAPAVGQLLDPECEVVCLCHHGVRSMQVAQFLVGRAGFGAVRNVTGGIDAYSRVVDPGVPIY